MSPYERLVNESISYLFPNCNQTHTKLPLSCQIRTEVLQACGASPQWLYGFNDLMPETSLGDIHFVLALKVLPNFRSGTEKSGKSKCRVCGYAASANNNFVHAPQRDVNFLRHAILRYSHWLEEILQKHFAGMYRFHFHFSLLNDSQLFLRFLLRRCSIRSIFSIGR